MYDVEETLHCIECDAETLVAANSDDMIDWECSRCGVLHTLDVREYRAWQVEDAFLDREDWEQ